MSKRQNFSTRQQLISQGVPLNSVGPDPSRLQVRPCISGVPDYEPNEYWSVRTLGCINMDPRRLYLSNFCVSNFVSMRKIIALEVNKQICGLHLQNAEKQNWKSNARTQSLEAGNVTSKARIGCNIMHISNFILMQWFCGCLYETIRFLHYMYFILSKIVVKLLCVNKPKGFFIKMR